MDRVKELVETLTAAPEKAAYGALRELEALSRQSDQVYPYFDRFLAMLGSPSSYIRNRGLILLAQNARWDTEGRVDRALDAYLAHILDEKPVTARQCIQNLSAILDAKPELSSKIRTALEGADFSHYPDSMSPLLHRDAIHILKEIDRTDRNDK